MKKTSPDLYDLIESLNKSEKSYFKKYSRIYTSGVSAYLKLFDAVDKQVKKGNGYDEEALKRSLKNEKFVTQISVAKNFLYNLIVKNLVQFNLDDTGNSRLHEMTGAVEILFKRCLFDQSEKMLIKAKKLAYETENHPKLYELLQWEKNLVSEKGPANSGERYNQIYSEEKMVVEILGQSSKIKNLYAVIGSIMMEGGFSRSSENKAKLKEIMKDPILKDINKMMTFQNKTFFNDIYVMYYSMIRDFDKYYKYIKATAVLYESNPDMIRKRTADYVLLIHNLLSGCLYLKKFDEYRKFLEEYQTAHKRYGYKTDWYIKLVDFFIRKHELLYYNAKGEFEEGVKFVGPYIQEMNKNLDKIDKREMHLIYYHCGVIHFGNGDFEKALEYMNKILLGKEPEQRKDIHLSAKLLSLIIHYELGNMDYLESLIRSIYRYLKSREVEYGFEKLLIKFFRSIPGKITKKELIELFKENRYELNRLLKDPDEIAGTLNFDYASWLESRINGKEFKEVVRENLEREAVQ